MKIRRFRELAPLERAEVVLVIISMGLFPYGMLSPNTPLAVAGVLCLGLGCFLGRLHNLAKVKQVR